MVEETLTEEEMTRWVDLMTMMSSDDLGRAHEMLFSAIMEIRRHRSVVADDEARVRSVVRDALGRAELIMAPLGTAALRIHDIDAICTRAAKQLAMARTGVSEGELRGLQLMRLHLEEGGHDWRDSTAMDDVRSARALLDRLER